MGKVMLEVNNLKTKYVTRFHEDVYAVDGVSLKIEEGKSLGVAGESGCGKSTLLKSLNRMNDLVEGCKITGSIALDGAHRGCGGRRRYYRRWKKNFRNETRRCPEKYSGQ